jgi:hypothetical protein
LGERQKVWWQLHEINCNKGVNVMQRNIVYLLLVRPVPKPAKFLKQA